MKLKILGLLCFLSILAYGQKSAGDSIPQKVQAAFTGEYPDAKLKNWEKTGGNFVAHAKIDGQQAKASFTSSGNWIETVYETDAKEMPGRISSYMANNYAEYKINLAQYTESKNNGAFYYLTIKKDGQEVAAEFFFDVSGNFMKKNEFIPMDKSVSTGQKMAAERKAAEDAEKKEREAKRAALLKMDRTVNMADLPTRVRDNFRKKYAKVEEVRWDTLDNYYTAHFAMNEMAITSTFSQTGDWQTSTEEIKEEEVIRQAIQYCGESYPGLKYKKGEKTTTRDRSIEFYVELFEKSKNTKEEIITKLWFDKNGKLIKAVEPAKDDSDEEDVATSDKKKKEEALDEEEEAKRDKDTDKDDGVVVTGEKISPKELPSKILSYVDLNYKGYKIKEAIFDDYPEFGSSYKVVVRREGLGQKNIELYFNNKGALLSDPTPHETKAAEKEAPKAAPAKKKKEEVAEEDEEQPAPKKSVSKAPAKSKGKGGKKVAPAFGGLSDSDVPEVIRKNFTKRYPKAADVVWSDDDNGKFSVEFLVNEIKNKLEFSPDGQIQVTHTDMDPGTLMGPIQRFIDDKYKGYKVRYAEKVLRKDRKNYFYVEIYSKKKNADPPDAQLYFDKSGRPIEQAPE
jgi:hypothetical protein